MGGARMLVIQEDGLLGGWHGRSLLYLLAQPLMFTLRSYLRSWLANLGFCLPLRLRFRRAAHDDIRKLIVGQGPRLFHDASLLPLGVPQLVLNLSTLLLERLALLDEGVNCLTVRVTSAVQERESLGRSIACAVRHYDTRFKVQQQRSLESESWAIKPHDELWLKPTPHSQAYSDEWSMCARWLSAFEGTVAVKKPKRNSGKLVEWGRRIRHMCFSIFVNHRRAGCEATPWPPPCVNSQRRRLCITEKSANPPMGPTLCQLSSVGYFDLRVSIWTECCACGSEHLSEKD